MAANNLIIPCSVRFGRNYSLRCLFMPLHVSSIYSCYRSDGFEIRLFRVLSRGKDLLFFVKKRLVPSCRMHHACSTVPVAAFTVNHRCPFKYRTRESAIEQVPIYTSLREKFKRKKRVVNKPLNSSKMVIVLRYIHRVEKYTQLKLATEMFKYIFVMAVFVYMYMF